MLKFLDGNSVGELDGNDDDIFEDIILVDYLHEDVENEHELENTYGEASGENKDNRNRADRNDNGSDNVDRENDASKNQNVENCDRNRNVENNWSYIEEETLIYYNESYPELWDHKEPDYKKAKKSALLDILCVELNHKFSRKYSYYLY